MKKNDLKLLFSLPVVVAALGYFVDIYDLLLFSIVRRPSLMSLGVPEDRLLIEGEFLLQAQMTGLGGHWLLAIGCWQDKGSQGVMIPC